MLYKLSKYDMSLYFNRSKFNQPSSLYFFPFNKKKQFTVNDSMISVKSSCCCLLCVVGYTVLNIENKLRSKVKTAIQLQNYYAIFPLDIQVYVAFCFLCFCFETAKKLVFCKTLLIFSLTICKGAFAKLNA